MYAKGKWSKSILQDVLYVPDLYGNLLSISHLARRSAKVHFVGEACRIYDKSKSLMLEGNLRNDLYVMRMQVDGPVAAKVAVLNTHPEEATFTHVKVLLEVSVEVSGLDVHLVKFEVMLSCEGEYCVEG